jgi:hypothetical protein
MYQRDSRWTGFGRILYWGLSRKSVEKLQIWIKSGTYIAHFTWRPKYVLLFLATLNFFKLLVTWCTTSLTFNNCTLCPHCVYVFCIYLRTNSDLCHLQHKVIGFYNRDEKCLLRCTDWVFNKSNLPFVFTGLNRHESPPFEWNGIRLLGWLRGINTTRTCHSVILQVQCLSCSRVVSGSLYHANGRTAGRRLSFRILWTHTGMLYVYLAIREYKYLQVPIDVSFWQRLLRYCKPCW